MTKVVADIQKHTTDEAFTRYKEQFNNLVKHRKPSSHRAGSENRTRQAHADEGKIRWAGQVVHVVHAFERMIEGLVCMPLQTKSVSSLQSKRSKAT